MPTESSNETNLVTNKMLARLTKAFSKLLSKKQNKLTGNSTQILGFDSNGNAVARAIPTYTSADVGALSATGTAVAATKLANSRTIRTNLASTSTESFNGTANITPGVTGILNIENGGTGNNTGLATSAAKLANSHSIQVNLASTSPQNFDGTANISPGVMGILGVANGGTGSNTGNAPSATKLLNARNFQINLANTGSMSFNGTANCTPGVTGILKIENGGTGNKTGLAASATKLATARSIRVDLTSENSKTFDGTAGITPGVSGILHPRNGGTGNKDGLAASATKLQTARSIDGVTFDGTADIKHSAECNTAAAIQTKTVSIPNFTLVDGARVIICFTNGNTHTNPYLSINGGSVTQITYDCNTVAGKTWPANVVLEMVYIHGNWHTIRSYCSVYTNSLYTPRYIDGAAFDGSADIVHFANCDTAPATAAKIVTIPGTFSLHTGARVLIHFMNGNTAPSPTLNVNGTGAKPINIRCVAPTDSGDCTWPAHSVYEFVYWSGYWADVSALKALNADRCEKAKQLLSPGGIRVNLGTTGYGYYYGNSDIDIGTTGTLPVNKGGTGYTSLTDTNYTTSRYRGISFSTSVPTSVTNGQIVMTYV